MSSSRTHAPPGGGPPDLTGVLVLLVEDSWHVASGLKSLLGAWGADVIGPAATVADAERLVSERVPDVALVDVNLRDGELAYGLIDRLHDQGIRVVVTSGYADLPLLQGKAVVILQKPLHEAQLIASLRP